MPVLEGDYWQNVLIDLSRGMAHFPVLKMKYPIDDFMLKKVIIMTINQYACTLHCIYQRA